MIKKTFITVFILFSVVLISCKKDFEVFDTHTDQLIGYWMIGESSDTLSNYKKVLALEDNCYGFVFKTDNVFIERKNAGWCGTPPITYADFEGTWSIDDSLICITVSYWGGTADYQWKIMSLDKDAMSIFKLKEDYHMEQ